MIEPSDDPDPETPEEMQESDLARRVGNKLDDEGEVIVRIVYELSGYSMPAVDRILNYVRSAMKQCTTEIVYAERQPK